MSSDSMLCMNKAKMQTERKLKFVKKFMKMAQAVATDNNACYSRQIGCIITDMDFRLLSMGYNGPPAHTPHCDTSDYLQNFFWPQLTMEEKINLTVQYDLQSDRLENDFAVKLHHCKTCPRRLINAGPGERSTLCSCQHAERNAITNASSDLRDSYIFCWCGVPCIDCSGAIINSGISEVHCLDAPDYHPTSRWLLSRGGVELFQYEPNYFEEKPYVSSEDAFV